MKSISPGHRRFVSTVLPVLSLAAFVPYAEAEILASPFVTDSAPAFNADYAAANVFDNTEFEYASAGQGVDTFFDFNFSVPQTFDKIVVINRDSVGFSDWIGDFTLTFDGGPTTASVLRTPLRGYSEIHSLGGVFTATTVRLDVDTIGTGDAFNNTGAMEIFFVRTPTGQTPIVPTIFNSATAFSPEYAAAGAIDGVVARSNEAGAPSRFEYASQSLGVDAFVDFDFGSVVPIGGFDFFDRIADEDRIYAFDLIFSQNDIFGDGDDVVKSYNPTGIGLGDEFAGVPARYIRFDVTDSNTAFGQNTGISEISFYQIPEPSSLALLGMGVLGLSIRRRR
ncbi:MAG: PEP-CTERM sorting domain-containing protein [Chthoniobacteraceae bacterium]